MSEIEISSKDQIIDGLDAIVWSLSIDGQRIAHLDAHRSGLILNIEVDDEHRGEGYARRLYEHADRDHGLYHVPAWGRSEDGAAFAEAMGGDVMDDQEAADILGLDLDQILGAIGADAE